MPIFDYYCKKCEQVVERLVKISEKDSQKCEKCSNNEDGEEVALERQEALSAGFQLKGKWFSTRGSY